MGYKGTVKNNVIILEQGIRLPDGTRVEVILEEQNKELRSSQRQSIRGKYVFVNTSSEDLAKRKQQEIVM